MLKPVTVEFSDDRIVLRTPYELKDTCKTLPGARWDQKLRVWTVPATPATAAAVLSAFTPNSPFVGEAILQQLSANHGYAALAKIREPHGGYKPPPCAKTECWRHQRRGYWLITQQAATMLAWEMGTGKSKVIVDAVANLRPERTLILCPLSVVPVWPAQFSIHCLTECRIIPLNSDSIASRALRLTRTIAAKKPFVAVLNYEASFREPMRTLLLSTDWDLVVCDECHPTGTMIASPHGDRPIESLSIGDVVWGLNHETGKIVPTHVCHLFKRLSDEPLLRVGQTWMTSDHPVWTAEEGYVPARTLREDNLIYCVAPKRSKSHALQKEIRADMRMVRKEVLGQSAYTKVLRKVVLYNKPKYPTGCQGTLSPMHESVAAKVRCSGKGCSLPRIRTQPLSLARNSSKGASCLAKAGILDAQRRKWTTTTSTPTTSIRAAGLDNRTSCSHGAGLLPSEHCQDRHSRTKPENRSRSRRILSQNEESQGQGCAQNKIPPTCRLVRPEIQEQGSRTKSRRGRATGSQYHILYNVETETGNYFAEGLLVHNSHRLKAPGGKTSRFLTELRGRSRRRVCLTGTPMPHSPLDIYAQYRFLDPGILGTSFVLFRTQYAVMGGFEGRQVVRFKNTKELHDKVSSIADFVKKSEALDLPPQLHEDRYVTLSDEALDIYRELRARFIAEVENGTVTPQNSLVRALRFQQITSGYVTTDDGRQECVDSAKADALRELLEQDLPQDEPVVVFSRFLHDIEQTRAIANVLVRPTSELSGRRKDVSAKWTPVPGEVLAAQIHSGALGIDLSAARYAVYYSTGFDGGDYEQSLSRLHRAGQTRPVTYVHLLAQRTIDVRIADVLAGRRELVKEILDEHHRESGPGQAD